MAGNLPVWLTAFKTQLAADKRKAAILGILFLVLIGVTVKTFVFGGSPAPATAAPVVTTRTPQKDSAELTVRPITQTVASQATPSSAARVDQRVDIARRYEHSAHTRPERTVAVDNIPLVLARDIFNTNSWTRFGRKTSYLSFGDGNLPGESKSKPAKPFWTSLAEEIGEYHQKRQLETKQMLDDLATLELQSTMTGATPLAYISGRLVREGDEIKKFSVVYIGERHVLLRRQGVDHELAMR